jgi:hypothetical protein
MGAERRTDTQASCILGIVDAKVFLQTTETSGGDVVSVQVVHNIDKDEERASRIQLSLQRLLRPFSTLRIHVGDMSAFRSELGRAFVALVSSDMALGSVVCHDEMGGDGIACANVCPMGNPSL